jgi:hypothetical protein
VNTIWQTPSGVVLTRHVADVEPHQPISLPANDEDVAAEAVQAQPPWAPRTSAQMAQALIDAGAVPTDWVAVAHDHPITDEQAARIDQLAWGGSGLITQPIALAKLKTKAAAALDAACAAQIVAGFSSLALGTAHLYPAKPTDQANLTASVLDGVINQADTSWRTPFWCADSAGLWAWREHSAVQIKQVGQDGKAAVIAAQTKNATLQAQVAAATSEAALAAIAW